MKPILFNTDNVRAIMDGRKTAKRLPLKPQPKSEEENPHRVFLGDYYFDVEDDRFGGLGRSVGPYTPPYLPGDILYVRETFTKQCGEYIYKANATHTKIWNGMWRPSVHMPREAARIFLRVTDVRVERLQDITTEQAMKDGVISEKNRIFPELWDKSIKPSKRPVYGWAANPWVWVIEFERISKEEALKQ